MTSVAVISSAVARINRLKNDENNMQSEGLPKETDGILEQLGKIKDTLEAAHDPKKKAAGSEFVDLEKKVLRLSYEVVDAISDAASVKPRRERSFTNPLLHRKKPGFTRQLEELQKHQTDLQDLLPNQTNYLQDFLAPKDDSTGSEEKKQGREELLEELRTQLLNVESSSTEVYLVGESGIGKTTLARRLFHDSKIRKHFKFFAWVTLTHNFQIKDVLQQLLQQLDPQLDIISKMNEIDLISSIFDLLLHKKKHCLFLLVLEDIQSMDDWESIRLALPTAESSRVIITSSNKDIISKAIENEDHRFHHISGLNEAEIITLLKEEAAFRSDDVGKAICKISRGSPLLAIILGKSLQSSKENDEQLVHELQSNIPNIKTAGAPRVLEATYKRLGSELKPHLLYLGQFPAGEDVDIDKLYLLLEAENLIKEAENISPQSLSEYLKELEGLKLVQVQEDHILPKRGMYKSCKLHDQVWEFCKSKATEEEFFEILDLGNPKEVGSETRRLAVHLRAESKKSAAQSIKPAALKKLWTLVIIDTFEKKSDWPSELKDLADSSYLRILSFDGVDFGDRGKLLKGMEKLNLLRFLSFRGCFLKELPSSLSKLTQLETLDLLVRDECEVMIPESIFSNMKRMVHLYLPSKYGSGGDDGKTKLKLQGMESLEILVNFNTEVCDVGDLKQFNKLKILSTISKGNLDDVLFTFLTQGPGKGLEYSSVGITSFDCYNSDGLSRLQQLLGRGSVHSVSIEGRIGGMIQKKEEDTSCAETIGEIVLDGSQLQHDPMTYLCNFQNLHSLVLSNDAFLGTLITISAANPFPNLRSLKLHMLKFLKKLTFREEAVPKLSALQIHSCASLSELFIPRELDERLKKAQENNGGDTYSVVPLPSKFNIAQV